MTDFGVYARAAWAVRTGEDIYSITDNNDWHYIYPPTLAILMTPLADPPMNAPRLGYVPYELGVAIWYVLGVAVLFWSIERLASSIEQVVPDRFNVEALGQVAIARSNQLRIGPLLICLPHVGNTLSRGQVGCIWLWLTIGIAAELLRRRSLRAGIYLAGAICLKVIPAYLLLIPAVRRDCRMIAGTIAATVFGLGLLPVAVFGPARTVQTYQSLVERVLAPGLGSGDDRTVAAELTDITATRSQSPLAIFHHWRYWQVDRYQRPGQPSQATRIAHWLAAVSIAAAVFWIDRRLVHDSLRELVLLANLSMAMILSSPVCHLHYFVLCLPLVACLFARDFKLSDCATARSTTLLASACFAFVSTLTLLPNTPRIQDSGALPAIALILMGLSRRRDMQPAPAEAADPIDVVANKAA